MCHLNITIKTDQSKVTTYPEYAFLAAVTNQSFQHNNHGEGVYFDAGKCIKSYDKINYSRLIRYIAKSKCIITHQRYATSGFEKRFVHPYEDKDFVFVHNGVISELAQDELSDSFVLFKRLTNAFSNCSGTRHARIIKAIKKTFNKLSGSWSVAIFDKVKKELYYLKNSSPTINFYLGVKKTELYITTSHNNYEFLPIIGELEEYPVNPYIIYRINYEGSTISIKECGKIKEEEYGWTDPSYNTSNRKLIYDLANYSKEPHESIRELLDKYVSPGKKERCELCQNKTTNNLIYSGQQICTDCLEEDPLILDEEKALEDSRRSYV